ncbi:MAG: DUF1684 domain-containing protein [Vicinamibacterales bacterium]
MSRTVRTLPLLLVVALCAGACGSPPVSYPEEIAAWRAEKDAFMHSAESPVPADRRKAFQPLPYYPIDEQYRVPAGLKVLRGDEIIELSTSTGVPRRMRRIGTLAFTLKGESRTLTAFADVDDAQLQRLFVPFADLTSGTETYQGGRYLDLDRTASGVYDLDFNRAYHPFCVFDATYECPIPPRENRLKVAVRAGEKLS